MCTLLSASVPLKFKGQIAQEELALHGNGRIKIDYQKNTDTESIVPTAECKVVVTVLR